MGIGEEARLDVVAVLRRLVFATAEPEPGIVQLGGGLSGSTVWQIELDGHALVLKVTSADSDRELLVRAGREVDFYRDLAHHIPLRVPDCIGQSVDEQGVALLLVAELPVPPLDAWSERDFQQVAHELGTLHGTFWGKSRRARLPGWLRQASGVTVERSAAAQRDWEEMELPANLHPQRDVMVQLVRQAAALDREIANLPLTLCHGDAHRDNLLQTEAGDWVWADWQEVRLGQGVVDLVFFWQRAFTVLPDIPGSELLVETYGESLVRAGAAPVSSIELTRAVAWSELRMWAIDWPPYLGWLPPIVTERVLQRCEELVGRLGINGRSV